MKIRCVICKQEEELTKEEIAETGSFVDTNELDVSAYLEYLALKKGKRCVVGDGKGEKKRKHAFILAEETNKELDLILGAHKNDMIFSEGNKIARDICMKSIAELEETLKREKVEVEKLNELISVKENEIKEKRERFKDMTGSSKIEIWE